MKVSKNLKKVILGGAFVALTVIGAWISIPIGNIPITLQLFFVLLSGFILGPKYGFWTQVAYLSLGAIGLPVFANFAGGATVFFTPVGGYLLAFPIAALCAGKCITIKNKTTNFAWSVLLPICIIYASGATILNIFLKSPKKAIMIGVFPFIGIDLVKAIIAYIIALKVNNLTKYNNMLKINKGE